ncbi:MAG TPA: DinB family protein [Thermoanaerobaculia bacterium]|nr:DinB family protein [Thermoanaerobaculia bacterium]
MLQTIETLRAFPPRLAAAVAGLSEEEIARPEAEGKWSVADVVAHLFDLELVYAVRIRTILGGAGDTPLQALAQDDWVTRVHRREPAAELLQDFGALRRMNLMLLSRLSDEELDRTGLHPQYGALSVRGAFERIQRHDEKHLAQVERIKRGMRDEGLGGGPHRA